MEIKTELANISMLFCHFVVPLMNPSTPFTSNIHSHNFNMKITVSSLLFFVSMIYRKGNENQL